MDTLLTEIMVLREVREIAQWAGTQLLYVGYHERTASLCGPGFVSRFRLARGSLVEIYFNGGLMIARIWHGMVPNSLALGQIVLLEATWNVRDRDLGPV
jgi:hypothetical protein